MGFSRRGSHKSAPINTQQKRLSLVLDTFCKISDDYKSLAAYLMHHNEQLTGHFSRGKIKFATAIEEGAFLGNRKLHNYMLNALVCK